MAVSLFLYAFIILALLVAEVREDRRAQYIFKPFATLGFILLALQCGALDSVYGQIILAGLVACTIGDMFLLSRNSEILFIGGMIAFGLGHLFYLIAFASNSAPPISNIVDPGFSFPNGLVVIPLAFGFLVGLVVYRGIIPKLSKLMKLAIALYVVIIFLMVFFASYVDLKGMLIFVPVAAMMFAVSDMFVAKDRFVKSNPKNALAITPLYFGAQALFALSVSI